MQRPRYAIYVLVGILVATSWCRAESRTVRIGVLSHRGDAVTLAMWKPTAGYLSQTVPDLSFEIVPLDFAEVEPTVAANAVDFLLVNPGIYVNMEVRHRVSRIATMNNRRGDIPLNIFGGVIFVRADRSDIATLEDLKGHSFMAVDETSLGGFQMAWRELNAVGIDPYRDFTQLRFAGIHDAVVRAVLRGEVDAGTVRTDILERMAGAGVVDLAAIRVIHPLDSPEFPFLLSTRLYPEWPFSKLGHTPIELARAVAVALLRMPRDHPAAIAGEYAGWTIPLDYQSVHQLFRELKLPPYEFLGRLTLVDAIRRYWYWLLAATAILLIASLLTVWVLRLNKRLKQAQLRLQHRHELILDSVADGIYGVDLDGKATFVNQAMERLTGWIPTDLIGQSQHEILHHTRADGSHHPAPECPVYTSFRDNETRFIDDDLFWKKDGTSFPVEYSCTPLKDGRGKTLGSVVVFRDITERLQAREEARQHLLELAHVSRLSTLGEMASGIAHELNQPLTAISANARACIRLLESDRPSHERCGDVMDKIASQAERAGEVIRQIRHFVRKEQPERRPVALSQILRTVVDLIRPDARREGVTLRLGPIDRDMRVLVQEIQIEQVIINLARNAVEAMTESLAGTRTLTLDTTALDDGDVEVRVTDTGPGLSVQVAERIFEPFVTTKPQGLGLGLSISQGIVTAHGSRLTVETTPGVGTSFIFTLPGCPGESLGANGTSAGEP